MQDIFSIVRFKRLRENAVIPTRGTPVAAGLDLYAVESAIIPVGQYGAVSTGVALELPSGYEGQVRPRSGLALKHGVTVLNSPGTIDEDYRGEVKVILINHGGRPFEIKAGDRIGQLVVAPVAILKVEETQDLTSTSRGDKGFGSTGR